jgi:hypothetical protein
MRSYGRAAAPAAAAAAESEDPAFIPWTSILPTLTSGYDPTSSNICVSGS